MHRPLHCLSPKDNFWALRENSGLTTELYTFLLETRAEQQMQKASNVSDCDVIDPADEHFSALVSPDPGKVYFVGLFSGVGIPF